MAEFLFEDVELAQEVGMVRQCVVDDQRVGAQIPDHRLDVRVKAHQASMAAIVQIVEQLCSHIKRRFHVRVMVEGNERITVVRRVRAG